MVHGMAVGGSYIFQRRDRDIGYFRFLLGAGERPGSRRFLNHYQDYYIVLNGPRSVVNLRIGRSNLPFGLIATYDSHERLIQNLYEKTVGIRKDTGVALFGYFGDYMYDMAATTGSGRTDLSSGKLDLFTARVGRKTANIAYGVSFISGFVPDESIDLIADLEVPITKADRVRKNYLNLDYLAASGPYSVAMEIAYGTEERHSHRGIFLAVDFQLPEPSGPKTTVLTLFLNSMRSDETLDCKQKAGFETALFPTEKISVRVQMFYFENMEKAVSNAGSVVYMSVAWRS